MVARDLKIHLPDAAAQSDQNTLKYHLCVSPQPVCGGSVFLPHSRPSVQSEPRDWRSGAAPVWAGGSGDCEPRGISGPTIHASIFLSGEIQSRKFDTAGWNSVSFRTAGGVGQSGKKRIHYEEVSPKPSPRGDVPPEKLLARRQNFQTEFRGLSVT